MDRHVLLGDRGDPGGRPRTRCLVGPARSSLCGRGRGGSGRHRQRSGAVRLGGVAVGGELSGVIEDHDAIAEQAPTLFGVGRHDTCCGVVIRFRRGALRPVVAHVTIPFLVQPLLRTTQQCLRACPGVCAATPQSLRLPATPTACLLAGTDARLARSGVNPSSDTEARVKTVPPRPPLDRR